MRVVVGRIGRPHGIRGQVTVEPRTDEPEQRFAPGSRLLIANTDDELVVSAMHWHSGRLLLAIEGVDDRNGAEALRDTGADVWDETGDNPYLGFLAHADAIIVTGDSVNMVSEATSTGKPVHVAHLEGGSNKFRRFHQNMESRGITRPFNGTIENWDYEPLDDTAMIAAEIRRRIAIA